MTFYYLKLFSRSEWRVTNTVLEAIEVSIFVYCTWLAYRKEGTGTGITETLYGDVFLFETIFSSEWSVLEAIEAIAFFVVVPEFQDEDKPLALLSQYITHATVTAAAVYIGVAVKWILWSWLVKSVKLFPQWMPPSKFLHDLNLSLGRRTFLSENTGFFPFWDVKNPRVKNRRRLQVSVQVVGLIVYLLSLSYILSAYLKSEARSVCFFW